MPFFFGKRTEGKDKRSQVSIKAPPLPEATDVLKLISANAKWKWNPTSRGWELRVFTWPDLCFLVLCCYCFLEIHIKHYNSGCKKLHKAGVQSRGTAAWVAWTTFWGLNSMGEHYTLDKACIVIYEILSVSNHKIKWWLSSLEAQLDSTNVISTNLITFSPANLPSATIPSAGVESSDGHHHWISGSRNLNYLHELQVIN